MRAPEFWYQAPGLRAHLLSPLGRLYFAATRRRLASGTPAKLPRPVICVGNLNAGGTGKTPTIIALVEHFNAQGIKPMVVTKGYKGKASAPVKVDPTAHTAEFVGDEPLLLASFCSTWVSKERLPGAQAAIEAGADVILLDDGFQDPSLYHDLSVLTVDAERGFGNRMGLPAGPLREPVDRGLDRADALVSIGSDIAQTAFLNEQPLPKDLPHFRAELRPLQTGMQWQGVRAMAFAGIGHPEKFFATLRDLGMSLAGTQALDDHQDLPVSLLTRLEAEAQRLNAQLVTTEKDAARLPVAFRTKVLTVPVRLKFADHNRLTALLDTLL
ncbi:MAG: tetraacyldisaccharide 4'-kinase [Pseudomonadota bacterium]